MNWKIQNVAMMVLVQQEDKEDGMNKVIFLARLGKDPEIRYAQASGNAIASFSIAVNRRFKRDNEPDADWFNCVAFGKTAEFCEKYLHKGSKVLIEGEVQNDNYEKDGVKHYGTKIVINKIEFAESKGSQSNSADNTEPETNAPADDGFMNIPDGVDEELPFA